MPEMEFDDLDLVVLRTAAALGPGLALSAAKLAKRLRMRPAQVQGSLDKLSKLKMLENRRLTHSGAAFMKFWQRSHDGHLRSPGALERTRLRELS